MSFVLRTTRDQNRSARAVILSLTAALFAFSCSSQTEFNRNGASTAATSTPPTGNEGSDLGSPVDNGVEINGQTITHYEDKSRIAEAFLPNGSLAVGQEVTMSSSYHTDPSDLIDEFGIKKGGTIKETQVATVVSSNMHENLKQPMTVALDLPPATGLLGLVYDNRNFFVVYTVHDSKTGQWRRGIMAEDENGVTVKNNRAVFQTDMLGRYEIFESVDPIEHAVKEKPVSEPDFENPPIAIEKVSPLVARSGDKITIDGKYFSKKTTVKIGGRDLAKTFVTPQQLLVSMPAGLSFGKVQVELTDGTNTAGSEMIAHTKSDAKTVPYADVDAKDVCNTQTFYDKAGVKRTGSKACNLTDCSTDKQQNCKATASYPAQRPATLPKLHMFKTLTVLDEQGLKNVPGMLTECKSSGAKDCRIAGDYVALEKGKLTPAILKKGITIPKNGEVANEIKGDYPSNAYPLAGADGSSPFVSASIDSIVVTTGNKYEFWNRFGQRQEFESKGGFADDTIRQGVTIHGFTGKTPGDETLCNKSGRQKCQVTDTYVAENKSLYIPSNFKAGESIGIITGTFPSAADPLEAVPPGVTEVTTAAGFYDALKSSGSFAYFNSKGQRITAQGSDELRAENIAKDKTIFGVTGTLGSVSSNTLTAKDIRAGVEIAGVTGELRTNCRNLAEPSTFNNGVGPSVAGLDKLDNASDIFSPKQNPWGKAEYSCTEDQWEVVSSTSDCNHAILKCAYKDKTTGAVWSGFINTQKQTWNGAKGYCGQLNDTNHQGFSSGWQLPTLSDLYEAYAHGLFYNNKYNSYFLDLNKTSDLLLWSQNTSEESANHRMVMHGHLGFADSKDTTHPSSGQQYVICVHKE